MGDFNGMDVSRSSFVGMDSESKLNVLYDLNVCMNIRLRELEKGRFVNRILASVFGVVAGSGCAAAKILYGGK